MKKLASALSVLILSATFVAAEDQSNITSRNAPVTSAPASEGRDITGFSTKNSPSVDPESTRLSPNLHPNLRPRTGGVFSDGARYGTVLISPTAPASYGMGEKYLAAPDTRWDLQHESGPAAHRSAGGIKLFSLEF